MTDKKVKVLFLCTGNSCRSQIAEGFCRDLHSSIIDVKSAGIVCHGLNPLAVEVMGEAGVDISHHQSQSLDAFDDVDFDCVVTVCGHANEVCPTFHADCKVLHVGFDDPPLLAANCENHQQAIIHYRRVRDEIAGFVQSLPALLQAKS